MSAPTGVTASVAVVGGSGFYEFLDDTEQVRVETPYGDPSAEVTVGYVQGTTVAFLPRHGEGHVFPPHLINYRANLWALRSLGVRQVLAPCAVGGSIALVTDMDAGIEPGEGVSHEEVLAAFARNLDRLKGILTEVVTNLPGTDGCSCSTWADGTRLPYDVPGES